MIVTNSNPNLVPPQVAPNYRPTTENLEERISFGTAKLSVARNILDLMYQQQEKNDCTEEEADLYRQAAEHVLMAMPF